MKRFVLAAMVVAGCGGGGGGSGGTLVTPEDTSATVTTPAGAQAGYVSIAYSLTDGDAEPLSISVAFSTDGGATFAPATAGPGGDGTAALASSAAGTAHTYVWNSVADVPGASTTVQIRITPADATVGVAAATANFTVNNVGNTAPSATGVSAPASDVGLVIVNYNLVDAESSACSVAVDYSTNGGISWTAAAAGPGGDATSLLASSPGGAAHRFVWNSFADGVALAAPVVAARVRVTPSDGAAGTAGATANFTVDNSATGSGLSIGAPFPLLVDAGAGSDHCDAIAADATHMYVAGHGGTTDDEWRIEKRRLEDGALDTGFDGDGRMAANLGPGNDRVQDLLVDATHLYVIGFRGLTAGPGPTLRAWHVEKRLKSTGALVWVIDDGTSLGDIIGPRGVILGGALFLVGIEETAGPDIQLRVQKHDLATGAPVTSFDGDGVLQSNVTANIDGALSVVTDGTHLYLGGTEDLITDTPSNGKLRIERRSPDTGALVPGFGVGGVVTLDVIPTMDEVVFDMVISGPHLYVFANIVDDAVVPITCGWRLEKRLLSDGSLVDSKSPSSPVDPTVTYTSNWFTAHGILAVDGANLYALSRSGVAGDWAWRLEKRTLATLALVPSFGTGGAVTINADAVASDEETPSGLAVVAGVVYMAGQHEPGGDSQWRVEARFR